MCLLYHIDGLNEIVQPILPLLPSEKFCELEKRIFHDKKKVGVNAIMNRSGMIENIYSLLSEGAITKNDLSDFSEELQNEIY